MSFTSASTRVDRGFCSRLSRDTSKTTHAHKAANKIAISPRQSARCHQAEAYGAGGDIGLAFVCSCEPQLLSDVEIMDYFEKNGLKCFTGTEHSTDTYNKCPRALKPVPCAGGYAQRERTGNDNCRNREQRVIRFDNSVDTSQNCRR